MTVRNVRALFVRPSLVFSRSVNLITMVQELRLTTRQGLIVFGWDVFRPSVQTLQRMLLDYAGELKRAPLRARARLGEFQGKRWKSPLALPAANPPRWPEWCCWAAAAVFAGFGYVRDWEPDWLGFAAFVSVFFGWRLSRANSRAGRSQHLVLGPDGLTVGSSAANCQVLPWDQIRFVRPHTLQDALTETAGAIDRLEIRLSDGQAVMIEGRGQNEFNHLLALLEPDLNTLAAAWERLAQGESLETAAGAEGLAGRT